jgi:hypothetical protein
VRVSPQRAASRLACSSNASSSLPVVRLIRLQHDPADICMSGAFRAASGGS